VKAVRFHRQGPPEVLRYGEAPEPDLAPGQVRVRVRACSVNHLDIWVRTVTANVSLPHIPGADAVGEVLDTGAGVTSVVPGQRVVIYPGLYDGTCPYCLAGEQSVCERFGIVGRQTDGTYAEIVAVPAANVVPISGALSWEAAAALPLTFVTAWHLLIARARLRAGETALIVGASGGLGTAAVQIAKAAGATVIATAGSEKKMARLTELGADAVIVYSQQDIAEAARRITGGRGVEVAMESVGPATFEKSLRSLARGGRLAICGATSGAAAAFDIRYLYDRQLSIIGSMLGTPAELARVLRLAEEGVLRPVIDRVLPLSQAADAHRLLEAGEVFGKIVLTVD
jgi:NADPH:quinone reductase-like Zn-dependent oxidoreductase